jgi:hypothetical protein
MPMPYFCGSTPSRRPKRSISCLDSEPRAPSAKKVYFAAQLDARREARLLAAVAGDAEIAGGDARPPRPPRHRAPRRRRSRG